MRPEKRGTASPGGARRQPRRNAGLAAIVVLAGILWGGLNGGAAACTILASPPGEYERQQATEMARLVEAADLAYVATIEGTGHDQSRYVLRRQRLLRGKGAPLYLRTPERPDSTCGGRYPSYSIDGTGRVLLGSKVLVLAVRRSWWRTRVLDVAYVDSRVGRAMTGMLRARKRETR